MALRAWFDAGRKQLTGVRVALGAVAPPVMLAPQTAGFLVGRPLNEERVLEAGEIAAQECRPIDDVRRATSYRRRLVRGLWPHVILDTDDGKVGDSRRTGGG